MEHFLELIAQNFWLVIIIVAGIISSLRGNPNNKKEERKYPPVRRTNRRAAPVESRIPNAERNQQRQSTTVRQKQNEVQQYKNLTLEQLRRKQLAELEARTKSMYDSTDDLDDYATYENRHNTLKKKVRHNKKANPLNEKRMKRMLSKEGIVDSIVMREILDSPRSKRPYRPRRYY